MNQIKLYNGDCLEILDDLIADGVKVDAVITDPPYGVGFKNDFYDDSYESVMAKLPEWFEQWYRILQNDSYLYLFVGVKTLHRWIDEGIKAGFNYKNIIATRSFNNGSITPKNSFGFQFQPIIVFSKGKGKPYNEVDFFPTSKEWFNDKRNKNPKPFTYQYTNFIPTNITYATEKRSTVSIHPNEKSIKLLKFLIEISTNECDTVLDSFMGSGTTGIACKESNRNFIGIEIDTKYFNVASERIEND